MICWSGSKIMKRGLKCSAQARSLKGSSSIDSLDIGTTTQLDIVATFEEDQDALNAISETNDKYDCTASLGAAEGEVWDHLVSRF
ncbi:putative 2,1-fructan:2,1-fructan 1-fructosyltransferase [Helianthus debilis subsp. tardiflorus]